MIKSLYDRRSYSKLFSAYVLFSVSLISAGGGNAELHELMQVRDYINHKDQKNIFTHEELLKIQPFLSAAKAACVKEARIKDYVDGDFASFQAGFANDYKDVVVSYAYVERDAEGDYDIESDCFKLNLLDGKHAFRSEWRSIQAEFANHHRDVVVSCAYDVCNENEIFNGDEYESCYGLSSLDKPSDKIVEGSYKKQFLVHPEDDNIVVRIHKYRTIKTYCKAYFDVSVFDLSRADKIIKDYQTLTMPELSLLYALDKARAFNRRLQLTPQEQDVFCDMLPALQDVAGKYATPYNKTLCQLVASVARELLERPDIAYENK